MRESGGISSFGSQSFTTINNPHAQSHKARPKGGDGQCPPITSMELGPREAKYIALRARSRRRVSSFFTYSVQTTCCGNEHVRHPGLQLTLMLPVHTCAIVTRPNEAWCPRIWEDWVNNFLRVGRGSHPAVHTAAKRILKNILPGARGAPLRGCHDHDQWCNFA